MISWLEEMINWMMGALVLETHDGTRWI